MKKLLFFVLLLACLTLTSCKKVTTKLTKENFDEFLTVHYEANPSKMLGSYFTQIDDLVEVRSIKKSSYKDVKIYVTVTFRYTVPGVENQIFKHFNHVLTLNENGYAKESLHKTLNESEYLIPQLSYYVDMKVTRITGEVTR